MSIYSDSTYFCKVGISSGFWLVLQGKRGIEKQPFQLPDFIAATGIEKIRQVTSFLWRVHYYNYAFMFHMLIFVMMKNVSLLRAFLNLYIF